MCCCCSWLTSHSLYHLTVHTASFDIDWLHLRRVYITLLLLLLGVYCNNNLFHMYIILFWCHSSTQTHFRIFISSYFLLFLCVVFLIFTTTACPVLRKNAPMPDDDGDRHTYLVSIIISIRNLLFVLLSALQCNNVWN